jgi:TPR repeat protein
MLLEQTDQAYRTLLEDENLPGAYRSLLQHYLHKSRRDPYEEALDLLHLDSEGIPPPSIFSYLVFVFQNETANRPEAWNDLGALYYLGANGQCNALKAKECYEKGEQAGDLNSTQNLGFLYRYGQGIEKDPAKAWYCFSRASLAGLMPSMLQCAWMMEEGIPFGKDLHTAFRIYEQLVENADPDEDFSLSVAALLGMGRLLDNPDLQLESWMDARTCYQSALQMAEDEIEEEDDPVLYAQLQQARQALERSALLH